MSWTKRQFVLQAFEEIGYASYAYDLQPEQLQAALRRLEAMMGTWNGLGVRLGYPLHDNPNNADLDEVTNVPSLANEAIYTNLALRIAPTVGKQVSAETKTAARRSYLEVLNKFTVPMEQQLPGTMPAGAGNKPWRQDNPFISPPEEPILAGEDGPIEFY